MIFQLYRRSDKKKAKIAAFPISAISVEILSPLLSFLRTYSKTASVGYLGTSIAIKGGTFIPTKGLEIGEMLIYEPGIGFSIQKLKDIGETRTFLFYKED